jgi:predicted signal transduction protein with EAL and GGDEF domain
LAHELGLAVTAEGVETAEQAAWLRALDVDLGQGFVFAPPLTYEALTQILASAALLPEGPEGVRGTDTDDVPAATAPCTPPTMTGTSSPFLGDDVEA